MTKYEERAFQSDKAKPSLAGLKNQLSRLKDDLGQFMARKPSGLVIAPLRERIRELEAEIAEAEADKMREKRAIVAAAEARRDTSETQQSTTERFPSHRR